MLKQPSQHIQLVLRGGPSIDIDTFSDQYRCLKPIFCPGKLTGQIDAIVSTGEIIQICCVDIVEFFQYLDIHINPSRGFMFDPTETILHQLTSRQRDIIIQRNFVVLLLWRDIRAVLIRPKGNALIYQHITPLLQFWKAQCSAFAICWVIFSPLCR